LPVRAAAERARLREAGLRRAELEAYKQQTRAGRHQVLLSLKASSVPFIALHHRSSTSH
jgi:hypothetical protein